MMPRNPKKQSKSYSYGKIKAEDRDPVSRCSILAATEKPKQTVPGKARINSGTQYYEAIALMLELQEGVHGAQQEL